MQNYFVDCYKIRNFTWTSNKNSCLTVRVVGQRPWLVSTVFICNSILQNYGNSQCCSINCNQNKTSLHSAELRLTGHTRQCRNFTGRSLTAFLLLMYVKVRHRSYDTTVCQDQTKVQFRTTLLARYLQVWDRIRKEPHLIRPVALCVQFEK